MFHPVCARIGGAVAAVLAVLAASACSPGPEADKASRTESLLQRLADDEAASDLATILGFGPPPSQASVGGPDVSGLAVADQARRDVRRLETLEGLLAVPEDGAHPDDARWRAVAIDILSRTADVARHGRGRVEPGLATPFTLSHLHGGYLEIPTLFSTADPFSTMRGAQDYATRLAQVPIALDDERQRFAMEWPQGLAPPRPVLEAARRQAASLRGDSPENSPFYHAFLVGLSTLEVRDPEVESALRKEVRTLLARAVQPAYDRLIAELDAAIASDRPSPEGLSASPGGDALYRDLLKLYSTQDLDPDDLHQIGRGKVREISVMIRAELDRIRMLGHALEAERTDPDALDASEQAAVAAGPLERDAVRILAQADAALVREAAADGATEAAGARPSVGRVLDMLARATLTDAEDAARNAARDPIPATEGETAPDPSPDPSMILVADLNARLEAAEQALPHFLPEVPDAAVTAFRMTGGFEPLGDVTRYAPPPAEGLSAASLYVDTEQAMTRPAWTLPTLLHHDGVPGRHTQTALEMENAGKPLYLRTVRQPAFCAGWALYAQDLAVEDGLLASDPLARIGYLQSLLLHAASVTADTGLHHKGWTLDETAAYLAETTGLPPERSRAEALRIAVWPGQAIASLVGREEIRRLRREAKIELGVKFDLKAFHAAVLTGGARPLGMVAADVAAWVEGQ